MARPRLRALVLAAGRGERLRPLSAELPKPLLPVAGRPLVHFTLEALRAVGCDAAALNLHHGGAALRAALGESFRGLPLVYSVEEELLGTGGALPPLAEFLGAAETVLVLNGDTLCRWPLARLLADHRRRRAAATLLVSRRAEPREFGGGVAIERGRVVAFRRGALAWAGAPVHRVFAGAAALAPELLGRLASGPADIVAALYEPLLAEGALIAAVETARAWHDLGTPRRYLEGALAAALGGLPPRGRRIAAGAEVAAGARVRRAMVESGARVEAGARVERALVLAGAVVGAGATVTDAILAPGVAVAPGARVAGAMLTRDPEGGANRATPLAPEEGR